MTEHQDDVQDLFELPDRPPPWTDAHRKAFDTAIANGVWSDALAVFARWWQLETWLRFLVYLELRAKHGANWVGPLPLHVLTERDAENAYMPSVDASNPLAYLDAGGLLKVIGRDDVWQLVEYALT